MNLETYYGDALPRLEYVEHALLNIIGQYPVQKTLDDFAPILYCKSRIKAPDSMMRKLSK